MQFLHADNEDFDQTGDAQADSSLRLAQFRRYVSLYCRSNCVFLL